jgi:predicted porin
VITLNILGFLAMLVVAVAFGAAMAVHIYGAHNAQTERDRRFNRDVDVNNEADMGECR